MTKSLDELKEMYLERYEYIESMYVTSQSGHTKRVYGNRLKEIKERIREIDEQLEAVR